LHECRRDEPSLHDGQVTLPGSRESFGQRASHPKLGIGNVNQVPPIFFPLDIRCLESSQAKFLFAKAKKVFQVEAALVALIDVGKGQFVTPFAHDQKPERTLASWIAIFVIAHNLNQSERVLIHGQAAIPGGRI